jgi:hypothetical protein
MTPAELRARHADRVTTYRPAEVAKLLHCSEWWLKEQARNRRIPFSWIGGSYRFTPEHITEILRIFEVPPDPRGPDAHSTNPTRRSRAQPSATPPPMRLAARPPRRALRAGPQAA